MRSRHSSASTRPLAEEHGNVRLRASALDDTADEINELVVGGADADAVQTEEDEATGQADPPVTVDEGVVLHQMEQIGRCLFRE
jgi:hypothetical protein